MPAHCSQFSDLRKEYPEFIYESYSYRFERGDLFVSYKFIQSADIVFRPEIVFRNCALTDDRLNELEASIFNIGMIELVSYYKACCSPSIIIRAGILNRSQLNFWEKLIYRGLGEFLYKNHINTSEESLFTLIVQSGRTVPPSYADIKEGLIIPVGGGKDSVVSLELLSEFNGLPLVLNPREASTESIRIAGYSKYFKVERQIDPLLLELNKNGFLNGHTPFSALLALISAAAALITKKKYIVLSNENSANEGNTYFSGIEINHQYSKSFEAESSLHDYIKEFISSDLHYFSFLRPLHELTIAKLFSKYKKHFSTFKSCNAGSKENKWCLKCPKCMFTYIILSPFIPEHEMEKIFGRDLYDDKELENIFFELCGLKGIKPFECVGTVSEINAAVSNRISYYYGDSLPYLLKCYCDRIKKSDIESNLKRFDSLMTGFSNENLLPHEYEEILKSNL